MTRLHKKGVKGTARGLNYPFFPYEVAPKSDNFLQIEGYTMGRIMQFYENVKEEGHHLMRVPPI